MSQRMQQFRSQGRTVEVLVLPAWELSTPPANSDKPPSNVWGLVATVGEAASEVDPANY